MRVSNRQTVCAFCLLAFEIYVIILLIQEGLS